MPSVQYDMAALLSVLLSLPLLLLCCEPMLAGPLTPHLSSVVGDPTFSGLRGQQYQVHGIDGGVYNLISDSSLQLNSQFTFLAAPRACPILPSTGRQSLSCFVHNGSYLGNVALRTNADDRVLVEAGDAFNGFASVSLNGRSINVADRATIHFTDRSAGSLYRTSTHELTIIAALYRIDIENSDGFVNLRSVTILPGHWTALTREAPHGLLGQTWRARGGRSESVIEGRVDEYMIEDDDLFGTLFAYNKFAAEVSSEALE